MVIIMNSTKFVILGGAGKIAKYHFEAIEKVGGEVVAVIDPKVTTYFDKKWYKSIEDYEIANPPLPEFFVICSPNNFHAEQTAWALRYGDVICEKPIALSTSELNWLIGEESLGHTKVHPIMQMRYHPMLAELHKQFKEIPPYEIDLDYVLPRRDDYTNSWQGDDRKSGGIIFNIGIHMLDFLIWTLGYPTDILVGFSHYMRVYGILHFYKTRVNFNFSTDPNSIGRRVLEFDNHPINLTSTLPLHTLAYQDIMNGHPLTLQDIKPTIQLCEEIRNYK